MSRSLFTTLGFLVSLALSPAALSAGPLDKNIQMTFACFEQCKRNIVTKVGEKWTTQIGPVNTFTISIVKADNQFELRAAGGTEIAFSMDTVLGDLSGGMTVNVIYKYKIEDDGKLISQSGGGEEGIFHGNGEVSIQGPTSCTIKKLPARGKYVFDVSCADDFSGIVELTSVERSPFI